jgi:hypothetical protein
MDQPIGRMVQRARLGNLARIGHGRPPGSFSMAAAACGSQGHLTRRSGAGPAGGRILATWPPDQTRGATFRPFERAGQPQGCVFGLKAKPAHAWLRVGNWGDERSCYKWGQSVAVDPADLAELRQRRIARRMPFLSLVSEALHRKASYAACALSRPCALATFLVIEPVPIRLKGASQCRKIRSGQESGWRSQEDCYFPPSSRPKVTMLTRRK